MTALSYANRGEWPPERLALLRSGYATATDARGFLNALNALPGKPLPNTEAVRMQAKRQRIEKDPAALAELRRKASARGSAAMVSMNTTHLTPPRAEAMPRLWADLTLSTKALMAALSEADPTMPPVRTKKVLYGYARKMGLPVPRGRSRKVAPPAPSTRKFAAPIGAPSWAQRITQDVSIAPPEDLTPEQQAELVDRRLAARHDKAREMLARKIDPDKVRAQTGLPLREVFRLVGEARMGAV